MGENENLTDVEELENEVESVVPESEDSVEDGASSEEATNEVVSFDSTELLMDIKKGVDDINASLSADPDSVVPELLRSVSPESSGIEGYYVDVNGYRVYIPCDRIQYLSKTSSGQLINLSSSTIYCYSLDNNGNRTNYYRMQSFGTMERQYTSGYNTYWESVGAYHSNSNITLGQTGIHTFTEFALFFILVFVGVIAIFRKGK